MNYPSKLIEDAVNAFSRLPGIGKKSALRLVLHLLQKEVMETEIFTEAILKMRTEIQFCAKCHNVSDDIECSICADPHRSTELICVVENFRDVLAIENTRHYKGRYHVLNGLISPMDGIGADQLNIDSLLSRVEKEPIKEVIIALNPTMDGDTTLFYLSRKLSNFPITITTIARGVAFGGELEYVDELTLARSISSRMPFDKYFTK